jgi:uncharacterized protein (DUF305 family)
MNKRISLILLAIAATFLSAALVRAQEPQQPAPPDQPEQPEGPRGPRDPLGDVMFPPEMIMEHQRELALTDEQKTFMRA